MPADLFLAVAMGALGALAGFVIAAEVVSWDAPGDDPKCPACGGEIDYRLNLPLLAWFVQFPRCHSCTWRATVWSWPHEWIAEHLALLRRPRRCRACGAGLGDPPGVSRAAWISLLARCPRCRAPLGKRYSLFVLGMGLLWAGVVLRLGLSAEVIAGLVFASLLIGIAVTDAALFIIPSEYSFGGFVLGVLWALRPGGISLSQGLLGALVGAALIWLVGVIGTWWAKREAMGTGDINMMAMVGMFLGWRGVLVTVLLGSLLGVLIVGPVALVRRERYLKLPFGVFLALGAVVAFVIGDAIIRWYVGFAIGG